MVHPILRRQIVLHIIFCGILLRLLCEDESLQHLDALVHRGGDSFRPLFVDEFLRPSEHLSDLLADTVQLGKVESVKRGHQSQLVLVISFERLADDVQSRADLGCQLIIPQGRTAVVKGGQLPGSPALSTPRNGQTGMERPAYHSLKTS